MACSCLNTACCTCYFDAGCFNPCGGLTFDDTTADYTGDYILKVGFLGQNIKIAAQQTAGQPLFFPLYGINEAFTYMGSIYDPYGDAVRIKGKDKVRFRTAKTYAIA